MSCSNFPTVVLSTTVWRVGSWARQLMTSTLLSPSPITAPVPCQYLIGNGRALPTATVSAPFDRQNTDHSTRRHRSDRTQDDENQPHDTLPAIVPVRNREISPNIRVKSP